MQSESVAEPVEAASGPSAGAQLRREREMRGLSIHDISDALKLSPRQVEALEQDDYEALPGPAFVRGFLRNYARCLGLDPAPLLDEVQRAARLGSIDLSPISNARGDLPVGGTPRSSAPVGLIVLVLLASVLAGWYFDWFRTEAPQQVVEGEVSVETELMPPAFDPQTSPLTMVEPAPGEAVEGAGGEAPPTDAAVAAPVPQAVPPAAVVGPPAPTAATQVTPTAVAASTPADAAATTPPAAPAPGAPAAEPVAAPTVEPEPAPPQGAQLAFRFGADSWVEVRDAGGNIVYSGISRAGTSRNVQGKPPFALVVGNAAQVSLEFNGKPVDLAPHTKVSVARLVVQ